jgi:carbonic anhydrase/acetyltransferase-like protein (isoleucine patch superfamily)
MKKFELTAETNVLLGRTLYRIRALRAFGDVDKGELGGFIEKETNLAHEGNAWVSGNARVFDNAIVYGNAKVSGASEVYGNAKVSGNAWVFDNAIVSGNAWVSGNAEVYGNAIVSGNAEIKQSSHYLVIGPIGSRDDLTTFFRSKALEIMVSCGCFFGTIKKFEEAVNKTHGDNQHGKVYRLAIEMARAQIDLTGEDETKSVEVDDG